MTEPTPELSLIISVYGQLECTRKCLHKLEETLSGKINYEVVIVDDASKDGTIEFLQSLGCSYRVFYNPINQGYAKNNNFAAREARGQYLCFLNNDVFVQGNWMFPMLQVLKEKSMVGMVGNVQRLANTFRYDHMGVVFAPQGNPRHFGQGFFHRPFKGQIKKWSAVTAACCMTTSEQFWKNGGFDEIYLNGCEDVDLCLRMSERGLSHYVVHDSVVEHLKGASEGRKLFNEKNSKILMERWGESILSGQSKTDQYEHAKTYLYRGIFRPWSINLNNLIEAALIFLRIKKIK